jgi:hypothetical protein
MAKLPRDSELNMSTDIEDYDKMVGGDTVAVASEDADALNPLDDEWNVWAIS